MYKYGKILIQKYFDEQSFVDSDIESFNRFMDQELNKIIEENKEIVPTIIPHNIDDFRIKLDKIWAVKPEITEADGSKRNIFPAEARLRKLTYSAPTYIEVSAHINGVQRESIQTEIGNIPVMLKSKWCHINNMNKQELIEKDEDPNEPGGYFIINGTEKVLITIEDLASNKFLIEKSTTGTSEFVGKLFSEYGSYKIPHTMEKLKDGMFYLTFTRVKRIPLIVLIKALGLLKDEEITKFISSENQYDEVILNLVEFASIKTEEESLDYIAKKVGITQSKDVRLDRMREILDKYLMPHIGINKEDRIFKAYNLCKMIKRFIRVSRGEFSTDDKDHYMNKRLKLSGDLLGDLLRLNLKVLIGDLLYNFQRIVKRGKFPSLKTIIRDKLLTQRIYSAMATGVWVSGRKGISQRIQRLNYLETLSHLQRIVSPLSASQENFQARELHSTHLGRLCPIETPEGTNIGLRKNLSLLCSISEQSNEDEAIKQLKNFGLKTIK
ncbi:DNA-directed RNA polymerase subunit B'' [Candidatus Woesearchaeota archaeon]|nr:DNA-directed RNA polymerase subunit B'' [Candidatus Woesearchaeota archaeon]|tara:strand:+ start:29 stop:1516 length:1488 start_codon:yes stop_codon:yes gene_type:complete